jgi:ABC-2 type transport system permease protein
MKMIYTVFKKEFLGFYKSPLFYLIAFLSTILLSVTFSMGLQNFAMSTSNSMYQMGVSSQQMNIHYAVFLQHLSFLNLMFMFFVPALAMRLIAEEKKNRTFDLLLTSPIESYQIVVGKFLALFSVVFSITLVACIYFIISRRMFEFSWGPTLVAAFGILLVGSVYSAVSLFASSLTENTMISFSLGIVFNISLWIVGGLS